jgi:hypothetical protein
MKIDKIIMNMSEQAKKDCEWAVYSKERILDGAAAKEQAAGLRLMKETEKSDTLRKELLHVEARRARAAEELCLAEEYRKICQDEYKTALRQLEDIMRMPTATDEAKIVRRNTEHGTEYRITYTEKS